MGASAGSATFRGVPSSADPGSVVSPNSAFAQDSLLSNAAPPTPKRRSPSASKQAATGRMRIRISMRRRPGPRRPLAPAWTSEPRPAKEIQTPPRLRRWPTPIRGAWRFRKERRPLRRRGWRRGFKNDSPRLRPSRRRFGRRRRPIKKRTVFGPPAAGASALEVFAISS